MQDTLQLRKIETIFKTKDKMTFISLNTKNNSDRLFKRKLIGLFVLVLFTAGVNVCIFQQQVSAFNHSIPDLDNTTSSTEQVIDLIQKPSINKLNLAS